MEHKDKRKEMARRILTARAGIVILPDGERLEDGIIGASWGTYEMILKLLNQVMWNITRGLLNDGFGREETKTLMHDMVDKVDDYLQNPREYENIHLPS